MRRIDINEAKPMLVEMLLYFHKYCEENNLSYFLTGGTLLGAVRHKGFIPWDDDIDLIVPRNDYEKLIFDFNNVSDRYKIISCKDRNYYLASSKIIDTHTVMKENYDTSMEIGLFLDVFPIDNLSDDLTEAKRMFNYLRKYRYALLIKNVSIDKDRKFLKNLLLVLGKFLLLPVKKSNLLNIIDSKSSKYKSENMTKYVGTVATGIYGEKEIFKREFFESRKLIEFENHEFYAPVGTKDLLTQLYGDYMKLPPKEQQVTHHDNIVWLKSEDEINNE